MEKSQVSFKKRTCLILFTVFVSLFILSSCNKKNIKNATCVKLTKNQIQHWVNKGFTDPKNSNYISSLRFKTAYAGSGTIFRVFVIGQRMDGSLIDESLTELSAVDTCKNGHINLSNFIVVATIPADWSDLKVLKNNGDVIDSLKYLQLVPINYFDSTTRITFLTYDPYIINKGGSPTKTITMSPYNLLPCPPCPNCKNPCPPPDGCVAPCNE